MSATVLINGRKSPDAKAYREPYGSLILIIEGYYYIVPPLGNSILLMDKGRHVELLGALWRFGDDVRFYQPMDWDSQLTWTKEGISFVGSEKKAVVVTDISPAE